jgi:hypothetical protein
LGGSGGGVRDARDAEMMCGGGLDEEGEVCHDRQGDGIHLGLEFVVECDCETEGRWARGTE